jgi:hypothetical protein
MAKPPDSYIEPSYRRTERGDFVDGVRFHTYHTGILSHAQISEDGKILVWRGNTHRDDRDDRVPTYFVRVIGHGEIRNDSGNRKRFRSEHAACRAGVKIYKEIHPHMIDGLQK